MRPCRPACLPAFLLPEPSRAELGLLPCMIAYKLLHLQENAALYMMERLGAQPADCAFMCGACRNHGKLRCWAEPSTPLSPPPRHPQHRPPTLFDILPCAQLPTSRSVRRRE